MIRRLLLLSLLLIFGGGLVPPLSAQDPVEFGRLSSDQRQLAEQVRRLEKILLALEKRESEEGSPARVELLKAARLKLTESDDERALATILEEVAADLTELRAGAALEQQVELIQLLEDLLDFLLETERREQVNSLLEEAKAREEALRDLASKQAELRKQTEALQKEEQSTGEKNDEKREKLADAQSDLNDEIRELAEKDPLASTSQETEEAAQAGEQAESDLRGDEEKQDGSEQDLPEANSETDPTESESDPAESDPAESNPTESENSESEKEGESEPQQPGESPSEADPSELKPGEPEPSEQSPGEQKPSEQSPGEQQPSEQKPGEQKPPEQKPPSSEDLQSAKEHQEEAEKMLKDAAEQAAEEAERLDDMKELESLINVLEKAEELAERHHRVVQEMTELVESLNGSSRVPRSARVQLRQWATVEKQIGVEADELMFEIREAGADTFPFLLRSIVEDHQMLAKRLGPPRYRANASGLELANRLEHDWERLLEAIRIEAERLREKAESPPQEGGDDGEDGPKPPQPLVSFAAEVQLLKMLQSDLRERVQSLHARQQMLSEAGIQMDEDDLADLENLAQRQKRLRSLFESILERLQEDQEGLGEDI